ncbi:MAG: DUF255 domain-containing protein [Balneolaceae bacterium]
MQKKHFILIGLSLFLGIFIYVSMSKVQPTVIENSPNWVSLQEAQAKAAASDKLILVDVYEVGCKYCRAMDREVFPDSTVRAVMDKGYIPVKIDGNSTELISFNNSQVASRDFAQSKGAYVFPTTLILDAEGNVLKKKTGFMGVDELRQFMYR